MENSLCIYTAATKHQVLGSVLHKSLAHRTAGDTSASVLIVQMRALNFRETEQLCLAFQEENLELPSGVFVSQPIELCSYSWRSGLRLQGHRFQGCIASLFDGVN